MDWGSFLAGGVVFGLLTFALGLTMGMLLKENGETSFEATLRNRLENLPVGEEAGFEITLWRDKIRGDDGFDTEDEDLPLHPSLRLGEGN